MQVTKQTSYYCKELGDSWIDVNDDGTIALCGFDWDKYSITELSKVARFIQYVVDCEKPSLFDDPRQMKLF